MTIAIGAAIHHGQNRLMDGHLRETDHAAVTSKEHQGQGDDAEDHRPADDLHQNEIAGDGGQNDEYDGEQKDRRVARHPLRECSAALRVGDLDRTGFGGLQERHCQRLPSSPCGRTASTITIITKVETVA